MKTNCGQQTPRAALVDYTARIIFNNHRGEELTDRLITDVVSAAFEHKGRSKMYGFRGYRNKWLDMGKRGFTQLKNDIAARVRFHEAINKSATGGK
jgi:hypothetical protein